MYSDMVGKNQFSYSISGRLMRKKMFLGYEKTENPKINDMLQKSRTAANVMSNSALDILRDTLSAAYSPC